MKKEQMSNEDIFKLEANEMAEAMGAEKPFPESGEDKELPVEAVETVVEAVVEENEEVEEALRKRKSKKS